MGKTGGKLLNFTSQQDGDADHGEDLKGTKKTTRGGKG